MMIIDACKQTIRGSLSPAPAQDDPRQKDMWELPVSSGNPRRQDTNLSYVKVI